MNVTEIVLLGPLNYDGGYFYSYQPLGRCAVWLVDCEHDSVKLCFVVVLLRVHKDPNYIFIHTLQGRFTGIKKSYDCLGVMGLLPDT